MLKPKNITCLAEKENIITKNYNTRESSKGCEACQLELAKLGRVLNETFLILKGDPYYIRVYINIK